MILYPAIDLKEGLCVRLVRGDMNTATIFSDDPAAQARRFEEAGFSWLHVVDLDGAFAGHPVNAPAVEAILGAVDLPVQLGGGIRELGVIESWLERGVERVILGTVAAREPRLVGEACRRFEGRIAIGIDARDGRVAVEGWAQETDLTAAELARRYEDAGAAAIIHTDITRDGALEGLNVEASAALARQTRTPVIASGGVSSLDDLKAVKAVEEAGIAGVICGRALYDGRIDAKQALEILEG